jgi:carotenoid cleavage dioxygenase
METTEHLTSPFLRGNYAPVGLEVTAEDLPARGRIPEALNGRYLKNGPNPARTPGGAYHWFTGDGMVHGVALRNGRAVSYRNRWVRTSKLAAQLGTTDPGGPPDLFPEHNPANTSVVAHADRLLALCEIGLPYELTPELATVGRYDFGGRLRPPMTAHPKIDPVSGELLFFGYSFAPPYLRYHVADRAGTLVRSDDLPLPGPALLHDFAVTARHVVFLDLPLLFDPELIGRSALPYAWHPEHGARVGVLPRDGAPQDVRWYELEPCFVWHTMNAFEDDAGRVVVDVLRYDDMFVDGAEALSGGSRPALTRWTVDPSAGRLTETRLDDRPFDFPRVDERRTGRAHRYGYGVELRATGADLQLGGLLKVDLGRGTVERHDVGPRRAAGEAVFVPDSRSGRAGEDDGWLLSFVHDADAEATDLVILDAADVGGEPVASVRLPQRVPYGFHSAWIPDPA